MNKIIKNMLKIFVGIGVVLTSSMFINSCSMIKGQSKTNIEEIQNSEYISESNKYLVSFKEDKGFIRENENKQTINFDYSYDSGIILCRYTEEIITDSEVKYKEKKLSFVIIQDEILYLRQKNILLKKI